MNPRPLKFTTLILILTAALSLTGCWTSPEVLAPPSGNPSLVGSMVVVETTKMTATVKSVDAARREIQLQRADHAITTLEVGSNVPNFDQIKVGDEVKAKATGEYAIFLVRNGPVPSAGGGVVLSGAAKGGPPAGTMLATEDFNARVIGVDRSYRLLKLEYADGRTKQFKVPLPFTLENVQKGDDVVVRATVEVALRLKKR